jgi:hypothetical protein
MAEGDYAKSQLLLIHVKPPATAGGSDKEKSPRAKSTRASNEISLQLFSSFFSGAS